MKYVQYFVDFLQLLQQKRSIINNGQHFKAIIILKLCLFLKVRVMPVMSYIVLSRTGKFIIALNMVKNTEAGFPLHNILKPSSNRSSSSERETYVYEIHVF